MTSCGSGPRHACRPGRGCFSCSAMPPPPAPPPPPPDRPPQPRPPRLGQRRLEPVAAGALGRQGGLSPDQGRGQVGVAPQLGRELTLRLSLPHPCLSHLLTQLSHLPSC